MDIVNPSITSTKIIMDGLNYYSKYKSIKIIDVPYIVPDHINRLTCPECVVLLPHGLDMSYVGSAEQSFLYYHEIGVIKKSSNYTENNYMAMTPCIRDEYLDDTHFATFLKCELFSYNPDEYIDFVSYALTFFEQYVDVYLEKTIDGFDINTVGTNIELGSYGQRTLMINNEQLTFSYGTAFAEPRLTYAMRK